MRQSHTGSDGAWIVTRADSRAPSLNHLLHYPVQPSCGFHIFVASITVKSQKGLEKLCNMEYLQILETRILEICQGEGMGLILVVLFTQLSGRRVANLSNSCTTFQLAFTPWVAITKAHSAICHYRTFKQKMSNAKILCDKLKMLNI